jgi:hypothetical protein
MSPRARQKNTTVIGAPGITRRDTARDTGATTGIDTTTTVTMIVTTTGETGMMTTMIATGTEETERTIPCIDVNRKRRFGVQGLVFT